MHAAPPVRVRIESSSWGWMLMVWLWSTAVVVVAVWLFWRGLSAVAMLVGVGVAIAMILVLARRLHDRNDVMLRWDGQRWFCESSGEPLAGHLRLHMDWCGHSLLSFMGEKPSRKHWLWATPRTVRGTWPDWRAALVQSCRRPVSSEGVVTP